jgi:hypothetical protein
VKVTLIRTLCLICLGWAGAEPIRSYQIVAGDQLIASVPYRPQTNPAALSVTLPGTLITAQPVRVVASESSSFPRCHRS